MSFEGEVSGAFDRYLEIRAQVLAGEQGWSALAACFTDDAVFIDPAWGRVEGIEAITAFLEESMVGLEGWTFPEAWTMVEGRRVVSMWDQCFSGPGGEVSQPGMSILYYAGNGKFCYEHDMLNMNQVMADITSSGWLPGEGFNIPPKHPDMDHSLDAVAHHLTTPEG